MSTSAFKRASSNTQNEFVESVTDIFKKKMKVELDFCTFIRIKADKTLDV